jgi:hypothetical protein
MLKPMLVLLLAILMFCCGVTPLASASSLAPETPGNFPAGMLLNGHYSSGVTLVSTSTTTAIATAATTTAATNTYVYNVTQYDFLMDGQSYVQYAITSGGNVPYTDYPSLEIVTPPIVTTVQAAEEPAALPTYVWDGNVTFVKAPGSVTTYVKYDHPDNYNVYYPMETNFDYVLQGKTRYIIHLSINDIQIAKSWNDLGSVIGAALALLGACIVVPPAAVVVAIIVAAAVLVNRAINYFLSDVLQTELGDGWMYEWGYGSWWMFHWLDLSFGAWRDFGLFLFWFGGGTSPTVDLNGDGKVDLADLTILAKAYGSTPRSSNWNPIADICGDGRVDLRDLVTLAKAYGTTVNYTVPTGPSGSSIDPYFYLQPSNETLT